MKRTLLTSAALVAIMGTTGAMAMNDGFIVETTGHPHEEAEHTAHNVWVQKVTDDTHSYELRMEDGDYIVKLDGKVVPNSQIKDKGSVIILMDKGGEVLYEFQTDRSVDHQVMGTAKAPMVIRTIRSGDMLPGDGNVSFGMTTDIQKRPKVMLGIYSGEPGESLREHLGITGDAIVVESVIKGLAADKAGLKDNDIILSINGSDGISPTGLTKLLGKQDPGDEIKMVILRKGEKIKVNAKLLAYDSQALGHSDSQNQIQAWVSDSPFDAGDGNSFFFSEKTQEDTYANILKELKGKGIRGDDLAKIEKSIRESLNENLWTRFGVDSANNRVLEFTDDGGHEHLFPELMHKKAEQAMRDAERLTMEYRDGQLLLKRHAQGLEQHIAELNERMHESMPVIEEELQDRMEELEGRLDELESMLDARMESLSGLIERLIERLDED